MEGQRIELADSQQTIESQLRSLCCSRIKHWENLKADERFDVEPLAGGLTNTLYRCSSKDGFSVVVRIFGEHSDFVIRREAEGEASRLLSERGFGKKVLAEFDNGRIEEWISGKAISLDEMRNSRISASIARRLALLHRQDLQGKLFNPNRPSFWTTINDYATKAAKVRFDDDDIKQHQLNLLDISRRLKQLALTKSFLVVKCHSPIVFCHNDLLSGNIVIDNSEAATHFIQFIDFEYAFYNHRGFDIANHFCELCGLECEWSLFPNPEFQKAFARAYLTELNGSDAMDHEVDALVKEVLPWTLASHLFWGLWAVIQASSSTIDFDYLHYAQNRFTGFDRFSSQLLTDSLRNELEQYEKRI